MADDSSVCRLLPVLLFCALVAAPAASASQLIDRNSQNVRLQVNAKGEALLSYTTAGKVRRVLAWGGINALPPSAGARQVSFRLDYAGGWGRYRKPIWKTFSNVCRPYAGPPLAWLVSACTAPDGSHWVVQAWQRALPDYGTAPSAQQAAWELRLSHWSGPLPLLTVHVNWAHRRFDHLFGSFTYLGQAVHGFRTKPSGAPLDAWGRNVYLDTLDSTYGPGWRRETGFLTHVDTGAFCYGLYPHGSFPSGKGVRYRATVVGPGVTPDIAWEGEPLGTYDLARDLQLHELQRSVYGSDKLCRPV